MKTIAGFVALSVALFAGSVELQLGAPNGFELAGKLPGLETQHPSVYQDLRDGTFDTLHWDAKVDYVAKFWLDTMGQLAEPGDESVSAMVEALEKLRHSPHPLNESEHVNEGLLIMFEAMIRTTATSDLSLRPDEPHQVER